MILLGTEWYQKNLVSSPITQFIKYFKLVLSLLGRFFLIFFNSFSNYFFCLKPWSKIHKEHLHQVLYWSNWSPRKCWNAKVFFLFSIKWTICCLILFSVVSLFGHHRSESGSSDLTKIRRFLQCNGIPRSAAGSCWRDSQWDQTFKVQFKFYFELICVSPVWSRAFLLKTFDKNPVWGHGGTVEMCVGRRLGRKTKGKSHLIKCSLA